eukprot:CAMPEP_0171671688 /NCGR_PEP_ID=MMETSP0990-20121206/51462_1 /TAXON_ID=483369 /ORGANISM="non described non described, Strain CCMP2098" /LENGTH=100 /DNA_ID=CAMNT_0012256673 /DNA_START=232 /DNA_END=534 /DNA_ORIENTATION=-
MSNSIPASTVAGASLFSAMVEVQAVLKALFGDCVNKFEGEGIGKSEGVSSLIDKSEAEGGGDDNSLLLHFLANILVFLPASFSRRVLESARSLEPQLEVV